MSILYTLFGKVRTIDDFVREMKKRKEDKAEIIIQTESDLTISQPFYKKQVFVYNKDYKVNLKINSFSCATIKEDEFEIELGIMQTRSMALQEALMYGHVLSGLHKFNVTINGKSLDDSQLLSKDLEKQIIFKEGCKFNTSK